MGTWTSPAQVPPVPSIRSDKEPDMSTVKMMYDYLKKMANVISALRNDLEYMINGNLDANNIRAKSITANKMNVDELSAISANLGTITAGIIRGIQIFGSYIATAEGTYPRTEMDVSGNLIAAYTTATNFLKVLSLYAGSPALLFDDGLIQGTIATTLGTLAIRSNKDLQVSADNNLRLNGSNVYVPSWSSFVNADTSQTLQQALNNLQSQINSLDSRVTALGG